MKLVQKLGVIGGSFLLAASFATNAQTAGSGEIKFTGKVIEAPCSVAPGSESQTVFLGQIAVKALEGGSSTAVQQFSIKLLDCDLTNGATPYSKVKVSFTGTLSTGAGNENVLANQAGIGGAANVGVQLLDSSNQPMSFTGTTLPLIADNNLITLGARLIKTSGSGPVTTGNVEATTVWTLSYL